MGVHSQVKELELTFDGIVSGFLGSEAQIEIVMDVIRQFGQEDTKVNHRRLWETTGRPTPPIRRPCAAA